MNSARIAGQIVGGLAVAFMLFDATLKIVHPAAVTEASAQLGFPDALNPTLAALELAGVAGYLFPRTSVLGALFLTGYLGGATLSRPDRQAAWS